jgi:hypothetical protein
VVVLVQHAREGTADIGDLVEAYAGLSVHHHLEQAAATGALDIELLELEACRAYGVPHDGLQRRAEITLLVRHLRRSLFSIMDECVPLSVSRRADSARHTDARLAG